MEQRDILDLEISFYDSSLNSDPERNINLLSVKFGKYVPTNCFVSKIPKFWRAGNLGNAWTSTIEGRKRVSRESAH